MELEDKKLALLIDADNISPSYMNIMLSEAKNYGSVSVRRIYGDWTSNSKNTWKSVMLDHSLTPIQQYSYTYGKNASDSAMIIDAMDILYADHVDGFILASSDSDFTRLAMRLREAGKFVIGMGESKTPAPFVKSCDEFKVLDILFKNSLSEEEKKLVKVDGRLQGVEQESLPAPITELSVIKKSMLEIIDKHSDENGQILLSELGRLLTRLYSDFDARNYGRYRKFSDFVKDLPELEITMKDTVAYAKKAEGDFGEDEKDLKSSRRNTGKAQGKRSGRTKAQSKSQTSNSGRNQSKSQAGNSGRNQSKSQADNSGNNQSKSQTKDSGKETIDSSAKGKGRGNSSRKKGK